MPSVLRPFSSTYLIEPRRAGHIDEIVVFFVLIEERLLRGALRLCGGTEFLDAAPFRQGDDVELFASGVKVGEAGDALIEQENVPVPDGVAEILHVVHGVRYEIPQRVIKRQMPLLDIAVQIRHIHPEGDAVERMGNGGEKLE